MRSGDRLIITILGVAVTAAVVGWVAVRSAGGPLKVRVARNGQTIEVFRLGKTAEPVERTYSSPEGKNAVRITSSSAEVVWSDCPDKLCVAAGPLTRPGQSAVCLPHRFSVTIEGDGGGKLDSVSR